MDIRDIFQEYTNKNIALIFIEDTNSNKEKVFLKTRIMGKTLNRNLVIEKMNLTDEEFYNKIILTTKNEIINLVKEQNLIEALLEIENLDVVKDKIIRIRIEELDS